MSIGWTNANIHPRARQARIQNRASNEGLLPSPPTTRRVGRACVHTPASAKVRRRPTPASAFAYMAALGSPSSTRFCPATCPPARLPRSDELLALRQAGLVHRLAPPGHALACSRRDTPLAVHNARHRLMRDTDQFGHVRHRRRTTITRHTGLPPARVQLR